MWCDDTIFICTLYKIWIHAKKTTKNNKAYYEYVFRGSCWSQRILVGHIASAICGSKGAVDISEKSFVQPWHVFIKPPDDIQTAQLYNCFAHSKVFFLRSWLAVAMKLLTWKVRSKGVLVKIFINQTSLKPVDQIFKVIDHRTPPPDKR